MKMYLILTLLVFMILVLFPFVSLAENSKNNAYKPNTSAETVNNTVTADQINVLRVSSGKTENIDTTEYLIGAVASEMSAAYHEEALKAQAVACYTYAKKLIASGTEIQNDADITDNSSTHQGYLNKEELKEKWGDKFDTYYSKLNEIVTAVQGEYICFDNEPILAAYHAVSSGITNSAKAVWNNDVSYLQSVSAPGDTLSSDIDSTVTLTADEVIKIAEAEGISLADADTEKLINIKNTEANGYVLSAEIGNTQVSGEQVRSIFSLKSPNFTVEYNDGKYIFNVKGKGHGVGMSQYSADFMARQGSTYKEILAHFYPGTAIDNDIS